MKKGGRVALFLRILTSLRGIRAMVAAFTGTAGRLKQETRSCEVHIERSIPVQV